mmetsp:Transcript_139261/g.444421  ORF Transcript_139261/g.444421 Transcript_139261/m.444421 type:complete len:521 (+) Transcript_139261:3-1565(+)
MTSGSKRLRRPPTPARCPGRLRTRRSAPAAVGFGMATAAGESRALLPVDEEAASPERYSLELRDAAASSGRRGLLFVRALTVASAFLLALLGLAVGSRHCAVSSATNFRGQPEMLEEASGVDDSINSESFEYIVHSKGRFCKTPGGFLWAGTCNECEQRCRLTSGCTYFTTYPRGWCQLSTACSEETDGTPESITYVKANITRVLFIGNSFTFVNDLPQQLAQVANSMGRSVHVATSVIGGCTLYAQRVGENNRTAKLLEQEWDYIVLQDQSLVPTVKAAREKYLYPAIDDFVHRKRRAKLVLYMTWAPQSGSQCPLSTNTVCFPLGSLESMTSPPCSSDDTYARTVSTFGCAGYTISRAYFEAGQRHGVDMVVPAGLAWQVALGLQAIPESCRASVDKEYSKPSPLRLPLPFYPSAVPDVQLYMMHADGQTGHHPSRIGQYLNALTFYAALFGEAPRSSVQPSCKDQCFGDSWVPQVAGTLDPPLAQDQLDALQHAATSAVAHCGTVCRQASLASSFFK